MWSPRGSAMGGFFLKKKFAPPRPMRHFHTRASMKNGPWRDKAASSSVLNVSQVVATAASTPKPRARETQSIGGLSRSSIRRAFVPMEATPNVAHLGVEDSVSPIREDDCRHIGLLAGLRPKPLHGVHGAPIGLEINYLSIRASDRSAVSEQSRSSDGEQPSRAAPHKPRSTRAIRPSRGKRHRALSRRMAASGCRWASTGLSTTMFDVASRRPWINWLQTAPRGPVATCRR